MSPLQRLKLFRTGCSKMLHGKDVGNSTAYLTRLLCLCHSPDARDHLETWLLFWLSASLCGKDSLRKNKVVKCKDQGRRSGHCVWSSGKLKWMNLRSLLAKSWEHPHLVRLRALGLKSQTPATPKTKFAENVFSFWCQILGRSL